MGTRAHTKFSHSGGINARRIRALKRLTSVKEPNKRQQEESAILEKRITTTGS